MSFVPLLQITPAAGRRHGRGGARTRLPLPAAITATSGYWILESGYTTQAFQNINLSMSIHPASLCYLDIGSLCCVYVLWVSVLKSNVSLFTVRVGPPSSVISRALSHYCITHWRWAGVWWVRLRAESDKKKYQNTGAHVYSGKWSKIVYTMSFIYRPQHYSHYIVMVWSSGKSRCVCVCVS